MVLLVLKFTITIYFSGTSPVTEELFASTAGRVTSPEYYNRAGDQAVFGIGLFSGNLVYRMCYSGPGTNSPEHLLLPHYHHGHSHVVCEKVGEKERALYTEE